MTDAHLQAPQKAGFGLGPLLDRVELVNVPINQGRHQNRAPSLEPGRRLFAHAVLLQLGFAMARPLLSGRLVTEGARFPMQNRIAAHDANGGSIAAGAVLAATCDDGGQLGAPETLRAQWRSTGAVSAIELLQVTDSTGLWSSGFQPLFLAQFQEKGRKIIALWGIGATSAFYSGVRPHVQRIAPYRFNYSHPLHPCTFTCPVPMTVAKF
ncbi:hypothetical protein [Denitratimonas sp. CY0512]|uniref:hypothetical protein n=1 Tax=Denitratimonas sp. CY0512 TaxID=3131940 RepID=UPI0030A59FE2